MACFKSSAFEALMQSGDYSDFTVRCKGTEFKVHKMVMGAGSGFFKGLFRSPCKVSNIKLSSLMTSKEGQLTLSRSPSITALNFPRTIR